MSGKSRRPPRGVRRDHLAVLPSPEGAEPNLPPDDLTGRPRPAWGSEASDADRDPHPPSAA